MKPNVDSKKILIVDIFKYGAVKFGKFTLKSGLESPIYMDIRICVSHPSFLTCIASTVEQIMQTSGVDYDHLCGVPYTALPIATCISTKIGRPMLMKRKEAKGYGTKQIIEGVYKAGDKVLIIEDIVTSGSSILETVNTLNDVGLQVTDAIVLIDREQGGKKILEDKGIKLHSVLKLTEIIDQLEKLSLITVEKGKECRDFLKNSNAKPTNSAMRLVPRKSFENREQLASQSVARKLFKTIISKRTNLCVAVDVLNSVELFDIIEQVGPYVCAIKTHIDILENFNYEETIPKLLELAKKYNFLIFEDRKFADIGNTVQLQYAKGVYRVADWADIVTVHGIPGEGIIKGLSSVAKSDRACVIVAEMSSAGNLTTDTYKKACANLVEKNANFAIGIVSQSRLLDSDSFIQFTPGVKIEQQADGLGQQYVTPEIAIKERGADVIIVGRGILNAGNPANEAKLYSERAWQAYQATL